MNEVAQEILLGEIITIAHLSRPSPLISGGAARDFARGAARHQPRV
jgi:hypothetical protein